MPPPEENVNLVLRCCRLSLALAATILMAAAACTACCMFLNYMHMKYIHVSNIHVPATAGRSKTQHEEEVKTFPASVRDAGLALQELFLEMLVLLYKRFVICALMVRSSPVVL
jgi:hypothetical protein